MTLSAHSTALARIVTVARAGSLTHALALFRAAGFDRACDDPAALAVAGRLAKDQALRAAPVDRPALLAQAAAAYAAADALVPQPYTRINQATLTWLGGDRAGGEALARGLLAWLDLGDHPPETAYWLAATRAEAHLLLGNRAAAEDWLGRAIAQQPDAWEDQAATLHQLGLILAAQGAEQGWLDPFRPGRVIHFGGHLGIGAPDAAALETRVQDLLATHRVIAGHGALAAGADLVIAAALLARGAELHVVLPIRPEAFIAQSVAPFGPFWLELYRRVAAAATSLQTVTSLTDGYQPLATRLAADVAMGAARLHARRLETRALQVLVTDRADPPFGQGAGTAYFGRRWQGGVPAAGAAGQDAAVDQVCLVEPRSADVSPSGSRPAEGRADLRLVTLLRIACAAVPDVPGEDSVDGPAEDEAFAHLVDTTLGPLRQRLAAAAPAPDFVIPAADGFIAGFLDLDRAWAYAAAALDQADHGPTLRLVGHYGLVHDLAGHGAILPAGPALVRLESMAELALPGVLVGSAELAAGICVNHSAALIVEEIGEDDMGPVFAMRPAPGQ